MKLEKSIQDFLLAEASAGRHPVLRDLVSRFGCSPMTASRARRALVESGLLPAPPRSRRPGTAPLTARESRLTSLGDSVPAPDDRTLVRDLLDIATGGGTLTTDEQRERLSHLAQHASREEVQISALSTLARLDAMAGAGRQNRRPSSLTDDELVERASLILRAIGRSHADRALALAFPS